MRWMPWPQPDPQHPWPDPIKSGVWRWALWASRRFVANDKLVDWLILPGSTVALAVYFAREFSLAVDWTNLWILIVSLVLVVFAIYSMELILAPYSQRNALRLINGTLNEELRAAKDAELRAAIVSHEVAMPLGWPAGDLARWSPYRLSVVIRNNGLGKHLEVVGLPGMEGIDPSSVEGTNPHDYGDFFLQWDLTSEQEKWIPAGKTWKLHILAGKSQQVAFLGPPDKAYHYKGLRVIGTLQFQIEIREHGFDRSVTESLTVGFDEAGKPILVESSYEAINS